MIRQTPLVRRLALLAACLLFAVVLGGCGPLLDPAAQQERVTLPAEPLAMGQHLTQTFHASRDRLTAIELLLAVYPKGQGDEAGDLVVSLQSEQDAADLGRLRLPVAGLRHNGRYRLDFPPETKSAGKTYRIVVESTTSAAARATPWRTDDDAYWGGELGLDGTKLPGDLAFRAYYDYDAAWLVSDLAATMSARGWIFLPALALLLLPGMALQRWCLRGLDLDAAEVVGLWLGLSISFWAVALLLVTVAGLQLGRESVAGLLVLAGVSVAASVVPGTRNDGEHRPAAARRHTLVGAVWSPAGGAFLVAAGALVLRYVHAKDLALPMWVDSVHHTLIADLIAGSGQVPVDFGPLLAPQPMNYHFGFHVLVAAMQWLTGMDAAAGVLFVGQLLGGLVVFSTYLFASRLSGDRRAGLVAALIVGLVSTLPAYYVSWGRYPQLAGLIVLPTAALLCAGLATRKHVGLLLPLTAVTLAGQVLVHPRVALFLVAYVAADLAVKALGRGLAVRRLAQLGLVYGGLAVVTGALLAPWLARLASSRPAAVMLGEQQPAAAFEFPLAVITGGTDAYLVAAALVACVVLGLIPRRRYAWVVVAWVGIALAMANPHRLGLPLYLFLSDHALAIALFLPIAVLVGALVAEGLTWLRVERWPRFARTLPALLAIAVGLWGGGQLAGIVNPGCILATAADVDVLRWVADNTPADAYFLVNAKQWQGTTSAGSDGGYWLTPLAKRRSTMPPLIYTTADPAEVAHVEAFADSLSLDPPTDAATLRRALLAEGVTHVYVGALGGPVHRDLLEGAPGFQLLYENGGAAVFAVAP
ncbi:MAG: DUF6541 family protein [Chloroflexota bacterium]